MSPPFTGAVRHAYVHIPFCRERCDYCDFVSAAVGPPAAVTGKKAGRQAAEREDMLDSYVAAVLAEWERERVAHGVARLETLHVGGGTPSVLGPRRLTRLLAAFERSLTPAAEITVETNPEDVTPGYALWVAGRGLRVSLGVQNFDGRRRAALGRRAAADPAEAFRRLRAAGVRDLSVDLIQGAPGHSLADLDDDIAAVLDLRPDHVSWYELEVVEGTALAARLRRDTVAAVAGDDERAAMYRRIVRALTQAGYDWYEVSNFALPHRRARHNMAYWRARPYLGLGPGAVSTVGGRRWTDLSDTAAYVEALRSGGEPPRELEKLSASDRARDRLMLAARCGLRVPLAEVAPALDHDSLPALVEAGMISLHGGTIAVTRKGRYVADEVSVRLFRD